MAVAEIGGRTEKILTREAKLDEIVIRTYSYQNGKGQEKVYHAKDCVEISTDSYEIPSTADNYEEIRNMLKTQKSDKIATLGNRMFYETYEVMQDYYDGKLSRDEVKDIFKEYFIITWERLRKMRKVQRIKGHRGLCCGLVMALRLLQDIWLGYMSISAEQIPEMLAPRTGKRAGNLWSAMG